MKASVVVSEVEIWFIEFWRLWETAESGRSGELEGSRFGVCIIVSVVSAGTASSVVLSIVAVSWEGSLEVGGASVASSALSAGVASVKLDISFAGALVGATEDV
jgi:hypothetical protein